MQTYWNSQRFVDSKVELITTTLKWLNFAPTTKKSGTLNIYINTVIRYKTLKLQLFWKNSALEESADLFVILQRVNIYFFFRENGDDLWGANKVY